MTAMKYQTIVVDPPWPMQKFRMRVAPTESVTLPYRTMSQRGDWDGIGNIRQLAADNAFLFLWTTHRFLPDAFDVISEWGGVQIYDDLA